MYGGEVIDMNVSEDGEVIDVNGSEDGEVIDPCFYACILKESMEDLVFITIVCPYSDCGQVFQVARGEENCRIFRCGVFKDTFDQIPQHACKAECDRLRHERLVYGCARPFILTPNDTTVACEYK